MWSVVPFVNYLQSDCVDHTCMVEISTQYLDMFPLSNILFLNLLNFESDYLLINPTIGSLTTIHAPRFHMVEELVELLVMEYWYISFLINPRRTKTFIGEY